MLKEALQWVSDSAKAAMGVSVVQLPDPHKFLVVDHQNGIHSEHETEPDPRYYRAYTLDDLCELVLRYGVKAPAESILVFSGKGKIQVVLDEDGKRMEEFELGLPYSGPYQKLSQLAKGGGVFTHPELIRLLRVDLHNCVDAEVVAKLRAIKTQTHVDGTSTVYHGNEGVSRSVVNKVAGVGSDLPDEIVCRVNVYEPLATDTWQVPVRCIFEVLPNGNFVLLPVSGELERAMSDTDALIKSQLKSRLKQAADVVCGSASA